MKFERYKIPEGHQLLMRDDGTFCFTHADGYKLHEGPIYPIIEGNSYYQEEFKRLLTKLEKLCDQ